MDCWDKLAVSLEADSHKDHHRASFIPWASWTALRSRHLLIRSKPKQRIACSFYPPFTRPLLSRCPPQIFPLRDQVGAKMGGIVRGHVRTPGPLNHIFPFLLSLPYATAGAQLLPSRLGRGGRMDKMGSSSRFFITNFRHLIEWFWSSFPEKNN